MKTVFVPVDLSHLNPAQADAVLATEGAVLVLAGAGTGKTKVLTTRLSHIVDSELATLSEVVGVTFTNKAANEMRERVRALLNETNRSLFQNNVWIGTFHSLALRVIRPHAEKLGLVDNFVVVDTDDQIRIIKKIMKEKNIDDRKYAPRAMSYYLNRWKDVLKKPEEARQSAKKLSNEEKAAQIYEPYQEALASLNAIDFGDILMKCVNLFRDYPELLAEYQQKFKYIMVDEYQDTNTAQYVWLKMLSSGHGNICCVGDDDQSIYGWRGAEIENILKFEKDFNGATVIRLERNYRSTGHILNTANALIAKNEARLDKNLWTEARDGAPVIVKRLSIPTEEASFIGGVITNKNRNGVAFRDMAVLVRVGFQTRLFEDKFLSSGIPYNVAGGVRFYERKEVKDAISYLRLIVNPDDGVSFERIINVPKRGIGAVTINKCYDLSREKGISLARAALELADEEGGATATKLKSFFGLLENWKKKAEIYAPAKLMQSVLTDSGYITMLSEKKNIEDEGRLETLTELISALSEFNSLTEFLDYIGLVLDNNTNDSLDRVTISTIHAAKGLEYNTVFIPGFEEGIFPHQRAIEEKGGGGIEEERRLCYVAVTRAKNELYITFCNRRDLQSRYGIFWQASSPSRFLKNLPQDSTRIV